MPKMIYSFFYFFYTNVSAFAVLFITTLPPIHWLSGSRSRKADDRDPCRWRGGEGRRHGDSEVLCLRLSRPSGHLEALRKRGMNV